MMHARSDLCICGGDGADEDYLYSAKWFDLVTGRVERLPDMRQERYRQHLARISC